MNPHAKSAASYSLQFLLTNTEALHDVEILRPRQDQAGRVNPQPMRDRKQYEPIPANTKPRLQVSSSPPEVSSVQ